MSIISKVANWNSLAMKNITSLNYLFILLLLLIINTSSAAAAVNGWSATTHEIKQGDFNNDGREDIYLVALPANELISIPYGIDINLEIITKIRDLILLANSEGSYSILYDPSHESIASINWTASTHHRLEFVDFDGDGKGDLLVRAIDQSYTDVVLLAVEEGQPPLINSDYTAPVIVNNNIPENIPARGSVSRPATQTAGLNLKGHFSISQAGKPNYNIPLTTLPTAGNVRPDLSINYSGENGDSILGVGWYLSGLSKITRCSTSIAQDGYVNGVNFNSSDKFCLNGERLIAILGAYGANNTVYRTENESFTRVQSFGVFGSGPSHFIVRKVTGEIEEYGASDSTYKSRKLTTTNSSAVAWSLNKVTDRENNKVEFYYNRDNANGIHYIDKIEDQKGRIQFAYENRSDFTKSHANSSLSQLPKRLKSLTNYFGSTAVRSYEFIYDFGTATVRSQLSGIRECASGVCTPYTHFEWDSGNETIAFTAHSKKTDSSSSPIGADHKRYHLADVNGDGKSDLIWVYRQGYKLGRVLYLANSQGTGFTKVSQDVETGYSASAITDVDHRYLTGDVNGDGKDDLVWIARSGNGITRVIYLANSAGTGFVSQGYEAEVYADLSGYSNASYLLTDVNADGRSDLVWAYIDTNNNAFVRAVYLAKSDSSGSIAFGKVSYETDLDFIPQYYENQRILSGDVNGDGKSDLIWMFTHLDKAYRAVYLANSNGTGFNRISVQADSFNTLAEDLQYTTGDVNGDGKSDIISTYKLGTTNSRTVYLATVAGTSHGKKDSVVDNDNALNHTARQYSSADLNGDGRSDLVYTYNDGSKFGWKSYQANLDGEGFTLKESNETLDSNATHQNHAYQLGDVNGDGKTDMVWTYNSSTGVLYHKLHTLPKSHPDHIVSITDGLGIKTDIHYDYLANGVGDFFTKSSGSQYPIRDDNGLSYVVTHTETDNGIGGKRRINYAYSGPKTELTGRGFLGFESRESTDTETGFVTLETYAQAFPSIGRKQSETVVASNGNPIEKAFYHWKSHSTATGVAFPYIKDQVAIKYDLTTSQSVFSALTENSYDLIYGNVTNSVTTTGSGFSGAIDSSFNPAATFSASSVTSKEQTLTTGSVYSNDASSNWRIGFLKDRTVTYAVPGEANRVLRSHNTPYASDTFLTRTETQYQNSGVSLTKTFVRDSYGNITTTTLSGDGIVSRTTKTSSYQDGLYPKDQTNDKGHTEDFKFNSHSGLLENHTNINDLETDIFYDGFGRLVLTKNTDGSEIETLFASCSTGCPTYSAYKAITTVSHSSSSDAGAPRKVEYFDALHRLLKTETQSFSGATISVNRTYDARGRLEGETIPYLGTVQWGSFEYDDLNRVTKSTRPDGKEVSTTYRAGGSHVTQETTETKVVLPGGSSKTLTSTIERNALGQAMNIVDAENIDTDYAYNAQGHLRWIRVANSSSSDVTITTDVAGNRTRLVDPDVGTVNYDYDAAGLLREVRYADGATVSTDYDTLNRIKTRTDRVNSNTTQNSWFYDSASNGRGKLDRIIGPGFYKQYDYDALSRVKEIAIRLSGTTEAQSIHYRYGPYSRLELLQYPDGFATETRYNSYGYKDEVINADNSDSYWRATAGDKWGNITAESYGNGLSTTRQYDDENGYLNTIRTGPSGSSTQVQDLTYTFDTEGNLKSRSSSNGHFSGENLKESFTYDKLFRLKTASSTGLSSGSRSLNYNYDSLGNIKDKTGVSDTNGYSYGANGGGIHAVSRITHAGSSNQYHYDDRGNMITAGDRTIGYTAYNKPNSISKPGTDTQFIYGPDRHRTHQVTNANGRLTETNYYGEGLFEVVTEGTITRSKSYVEDFLVHTSITNNSVAAGTEERYLLRDHIGSTEAISNESGQLTNRMVFAPYGSRRDDNWNKPNAVYESALPDLTFSTTSKGFTGHEHMDATGFIHMNGRMYDPAAGRFLSADTYVQFPEFSQSYNRYSYALNNPLSHTDPTGEVLPLLAYGGMAIWRAYSAYDTVTNGVESVKTLVNDNASGMQKAEAMLDLGSRVLGVNKVNAIAKEVFGKGKGLINKLSKRLGGSKLGKKTKTKAPTAKGKDSNTQNVGEGAGGVTKSAGKFDVGPYNQIKGTVPGLDAHHAGQKAVMKKLVGGYDPNAAPAILVPKVGHTIKGPNGIVSRSTKGIDSARDLLARDIKELRRVYPDAPNSQLQNLINLNKEIYPSSFTK